MIVASVRMRAASLAVPVTLFGYAAASGTLRIALLAGMLHWLPVELRDGHAAAAAVGRALDADGYA